MTDYDPYNDFWGDFLTGVVVTIIATRISDKTKDENDGCNNKKTKKKNYLDILDDFIIFALLFFVNPSSIKQIEVPNEFSMNKNFHKNCEVGNLLKWIAVSFLAAAWILFLSIWYNRSNEWWNELWNKQRSGLVLSNNFWQTKITTALTIVAITRLIDIYKNGGSSLYAEIFWGKDVDESTNP
ncbi:663_t:CDS:2 [Rhizophagus irregularis]|nr:663_t:CDS:2 [Rhizophagus irregularis]